MIARRLGLRVMLLERGRHPRFAIGESASPLAGVLIEQLADRYDLPRLRPLVGVRRVAARLSRRRLRAEARVHLLQARDRAAAMRAAPDRSNQLLVAASPNDELSDTHWLRSDVDHFLVREAIALGVEYLDEVELDAVEWHADATADAARARAGAVRCACARGFVVDASGPRGFLSRALGIEERGLRRLSADAGALLAFHRRRALRRDARLRTVALARPRTSAPAISDGRCGAASRVRRRLDVGAAVRQRRDQRRASRSTTRSRVSCGWPTASPRGGGFSRGIRRSRAVRRRAGHPRVHLDAASRVSRGGRGGQRLGDAAVGGGVRRSAVLDRDSADAARHRAGSRRRAGEMRGSRRPALARRSTERHARRGRSHRALHRRLLRRRFRASTRSSRYSMFYFAAASYTEMPRRLVPERVSGGFLRAADAGYASSLRELSPGVCVPGDDYFDRVARATESINIAGLCNRARRNWYPVDLEDTVRAADKLGLSREEARAALESLTPTSSLASPPAP